MCEGVWFGSGRRRKQSAIGRSSVGVDNGMILKGSSQVISTTSTKAVGFRWGPLGSVRRHMEPLNALAQTLCPTSPKLTLVQSLLPGFENVPLSHATHEAAPAFEYVPPAQLVQLAIPALEYMPPAQLSQLATPLPECLPASQSVQTLAPELDERPAAQAVHEAALVVDHVPPSHLVHALLASDE